jgi:hypothetical protein
VQRPPFVPPRVYYWNVKTRTCLCPSGASVRRQHDLDIARHGRASFAVVRFCGNALYRRLRGFSDAHQRGRGRAA